MITGNDVLLSLLLDKPLNCFNQNCAQVITNTRWWQHMDHSLTSDYPFGIFKSSSGSQQSWQ